MDEIKRSAEYAVKRAQAIRNCENHIAEVLWRSAKSIVAASKKYRGNGRLTNERAFIADARRITNEVAGDVNAYTESYSRVARRFLDSETAPVDKMLAGNIFGKTNSERTASYLANFAEDIVRMIKAGVMMGYSDSKILSAVRTGYKDPYRASVVTKAQRKDINIATPSYGRGIFRNAYQNIVRNSKQVVSMAWGFAEHEYGKSNGAIGFKVYRGSSFPCEICDNECSYTHTFRDPYPPFHVSCVCRAEMIYKKEDK